MKCPLKCETVLCFFIVHQFLSVLQGSKGDRGMPGYPGPKGMSIVGPKGEKVRGFHYLNEESLAIHEAIVFRDIITNQWREPTLLHLHAKWLKNV